MPTHYVQVAFDASIGGQFYIHPLGGDPVGGSASSTVPERFECGPTGKATSAQARIYGNLHFEGEDQFGNGGRFPLDFPLQGNLSANLTNIVWACSQSMRRPTDDSINVSLQTEGAGGQDVVLGGSLENPWYRTNLAQAWPTAVGTGGSTVSYGRRSANERSGERAADFDDRFYEAHGSYTESQRRISVARFLASHSASMGTDSTLESTISLTFGGGVENLGFGFTYVSQPYPSSGTPYRIDDKSLGANPRTGGIHPSDQGTGHTIFTEAGTAYDGSPALSWDVGKVYNFYRQDSTLLMTRTVSANPGSAGAGSVDFTETVSTPLVGVTGHVLWVEEAAGTPESGGSISLDVALSGDGTQPFESHSSGGSLAAVVAMQGAGGVPAPSEDGSGSISAAVALQGAGTLVTPSHSSAGSISATVALQGAGAVAAPSFSAGAALVWDLTALTAEHASLDGTEVVTQPAGMDLQWDGSMWTWAGVPDIEMVGGGSANCSLVEPIQGGWTRSVGRTWMAWPDVFGCSYQDTANWLCGVDDFGRAFTSMTLVDANSARLTLNAGEMTINSNSIVSTALHDFLEGAVAPVKVYLDGGLPPGLLPLADQITALDPLVWFKADEASGGLTNYGKDWAASISPDGVRNNIQFQYPIGSGGLVGVKPYGLNASFYRATSFNPNQYLDYTSVVFLEGPAGTASRMGLGFVRGNGSFFMVSVYALDGDPTTVKFRPQGQAETFAYGPTAQDRSGLWMVAFVATGGSMTVYENAIAGTPVAYVGPSWAAQNSVYVNLLTDDRLDAAALSAQTHIFAVDRALSQAELQDLWNQYQIEGA